MRIQTLLAATLAAIACGCAPKSGAAATAPAGQAGVPTTDEEKLFYALGFNTGDRMGLFTMSPAEQAMTVKGMSDALAGQKAPFEGMQALFPKISEMARSRQQARSVAEAAKGKEFAEKAAQEAGVEKTASGLLYKELTAGTGASPVATDQVKVHYRGTLTNGTEFDSSYARNAPATFPLNRVIPCWTEGVQKMKVGGKARLVCPSAIGYGDMGQPPKIPGGATLVFEVELLEIVKQPEAPPAPAPAAPAAAPEPPKHGQIKK